MTKDLDHATADAGIDLAEALARVCEAIPRPGVRLHHVPGLGHEIISIDSNISIQISRVLEAALVENGNAAEATVIDNGNRTTLVLVEPSTDFVNDIARYLPFEEW